MLEGTLAAGHTSTSLLQDRQAALAARPTSSPVVLLPVLASHSMAAQQPPPLQLAARAHTSSTTTGTTSTSSDVPSTPPNTEPMMATNGNEGQCVIVAVKTDGEDDNGNGVGPPVLLHGLATSAAIARMAGASFADFPPGINLTPNTVSATSSGLGMGSAGAMDTSGSSFFSPQGVAGMAGGSQSSLLTMVSSPDMDGTPTNKREVRLLKNREAAKECRRKKKEYVRCLENRVAVLEAQNSKLMEELKTLKDRYCHKVEEGIGGQDGVNVTVQSVPQGVAVALLNGIGQAVPQ